MHAYLQGEAHLAGRRGDTVLVRALVARRVQELLNQVAVGTVHLHAIEAGHDRQLGALGVFLDGRGDVRLGHRGRDGERLHLLLVGPHGPVACDCRRREHLAVGGRFNGCDTRPVCMICSTIFVPLACTALVIFFHAGTCFAS